jgi:Uma2 family endonuclease
MIELVTALVSPRQRRFTRAEYERLMELGFFQRERIELIHGVVCRMSPIGIAHRKVIDRLNKLLTTRVGDRALVSIQQPFLAWDDSVPEPDVAIVPEVDYTRHPDRALLLVEVAESSLEYDRETKAPLYAASGVPEYWIVNLIDHVIEVHADPAGAHYTSIRRASTAVPRAFPDITVDVAALLK